MVKPLGLRLPFMLLKIVLFIIIVLVALLARLGEVFGEIQP
jgi:hypothetical protein